MRAPALAKLHEIFPGQGGGRFELAPERHYPMRYRERRDTERRFLSV